MNNYFGEDLPTKKWNNEYGMPVIYLMDKYSINSGKYANRYLARDMPRFVLYENGQLIYGIVENERIVYYEVFLSKNEIDDIFIELNIPENELFEKNSVNAVSTWITDQSTTLLIINKKYQKIISIYGSLSQMDEKQKKFHIELLNIYDAIISYRNQHAKEWIPDYIEFSVSEWARAEYTSDWPDNFPDLFSSNTIKFDDRSYMLFIPKELYSEFMDYIIKMAEKQNRHIDRETITINGKKMLFGYKIPLPNIKYWRIKY
jgi:hypothetical protein